MHPIKVAKHLMARRWLHHYSHAILALPQEALSPVLAQMARHTRLSKRILLREYATMLRKEKLRR
jgi:hypothetical protein